MEMRKKMVVRAVSTVSYVALVTYLTGKCAIYGAYLERGYVAYGGEYLLIPVMAWVAYKAISNFFDVLAETERAEHNETRKKSTGSKNTAP